MKVLVLGHSGTAGYGVESLDQTWPGMLESMLRERGIEATVTSVTLVPVGARATEYALRKTEEAHPDVVVLSINAFPCSIPIVSESVRRRFGDRAHRVYLRLETLFGGSPAGKWQKSDRLAKRVARRVLGAVPLGTVEAVAEVYIGIIRQLAAREDAEVVAICESRFAPEVQRRVPAAQDAIARLHAMVRPVAEAHRITWLDAEDGLVDEDKARYYLPDGVHSSPEGSRCYASMLAPEVARLAGLEQKPA